MKKRYIFGGIAVLVIAIAIGINVNLNSQKSSNLSVLSMANIEVLASGEGVNITSCLGIWGPCTLNGGTSLAPLVSIN